MPNNAKPRSSRARKPSGSLLSPEAMGGIVAGKGFDFQTRYTACHLPVWLQEGLHQLFVEGTGDIDLRYVEAGGSVRVHIQVKDHEVKPAELKAVVASFRRVDKSLPGVYKCFTLVCPALSPRLQPLETGLARYRNAKPFYDDAADALTPTKTEVDARLRKVGLSNSDINFVHAKFHFEVGHGDLHHDDRAIDIFIARLLKHPDYVDKIRAAVQPAFAELLRAIHGKKGAVLERADVDRIIRSAVAPGGAEKGITIWVQNWTKETFDLPADYALDWSAHFDRQSRLVPPPEMWNMTLLPELKALKDHILASRTERLIRFRGKCALSTGVALGATFPAVGGWTYELHQPPAKAVWRSDATPKQPYDLHIEVTGSGPGSDLVLGLNIRGDGRDDVRRYIAGTKRPPKLFAFMAPPSQGSTSIAGPEEACAFAQAVRERLGQLIKDHGIQHTRLFFYGPFALAVFLGQQLTSLGEVQLFEYQDPGYVPSCLLRT